ncbi:type VI secretion system accessory protein TagJ [Piscinibacter defluvii]|uniref:type VI secretion system accessory protein TagJ n=1 Tax=Piscinibacter defluvii TaxID=1796922 RepID=UPI000FDD7F6D|nr:type VI secretion system accessory protein TagJ [Piscinibacter defluvii]
MADPRTDAEEALHAGDPRAALARLTEAVRAKPADAKLRIFLAQLLCVLGQWERAHTQLNVVADMDKLAIPMRETVGHAIRCELIRAQVFAGKRTPMVFGQPDAWLALLIESLLQKGQGDEAQSQDLAARAFDAAPAVGGKIDGTPFEWIMDADSRIGPVLEACVNGNYYWVPFARLARVSFDAPEDLRDCVWTPAQLQFVNGGETVALVPTRYPGSQDSPDGLVNLARKTEWLPIGNDRFAGLGQRVLATDAGEYDLMGVRQIELDELPAAPEGDGEAA